MANPGAVLGFFENSVATALNAELGRRLRGQRGVPCDRVLCPSRWLRRVVRRRAVPAGSPCLSASAGLNVWMKVYIHNIERQRELKRKGEGDYDRGIWRQKII